MADRVYLTRAGYEKLKKELDKLKIVERKEIVQEIKEAREQGDLSENAEYDAAKEKQGRIESRIAILEDKLGRAIIIDSEEFNNDEIRIGCEIKLLNLENNKEIIYIFVDESEANFSEKKISITSPVGQGLLGHKVNDFVEIVLPARTLKLKILSIIRV
ncbi:MAG: transcription elongation factor GreA [Elusimicrobiota bacterium]|jgi:transcription elongation factor GreA|nr:transcription elongation factor GreA [Elusimicrobiota bacterium]